MVFLLAYNIYVIGYEEIYLETAIKLLPDDEKGVSFLFLTSAKIERLQN